MVKKINNKLHIDYAEGVIEHRLLQVRDQKASSELSLVKAWTIKINPRNSQSVLKLIRDLSNIDPVPLQHVKRLQKTSQDELTVVVCSVQLMASSELERKLREDNVEFTDMRELEVPAHCPPTKGLSLEWGTKYWPLVWKGNPNDQILSEMTFNMDHIHQHLKLISAESLKIQTQTPEKIPIVTAIVDPNTNQVMAISSDSRNSCLLHHSVMCCINAVSETEQKSRQQKTTEEYHYLCTDYHVYTTHEPCTMCSMALIHSRVSRLIYLQRQPSTGALHPQSGEGYVIHDHKLLNSKFEVFEWIGDEYSCGSINSDINA